MFMCNAPQPNPLDELEWNLVYIYFKEKNPGGRALIDIVQVIRNGRYIFARNFQADEKRLVER